MKLTDIAKTLAPDAEVKVVGIRPGEKLHEQMISVEESPFTYFYNDHYRILPQIHDWYLDKNRIADGIKVKPMFKYSSDNNEEWLDCDGFRKMLKTLNLDM